MNGGEADFDAEIAGCLQLPQEMKEKTNNGKIFLVVYKEEKRTNN